MAFDTKEYVRKLSVELAENMRMPGGGHFVVIIKHYNSLAIPSGDVMELSEELKEFQIKYHYFNSQEVIGVYEPFLEVIRDMVYKNGVDIDTLMEESGVNSLHKSIVKAYLLRQPITRVEEYIYNEVEYEEEKMCISIVNMLEYFAKEKPIIFVLHKLQRASLSTIKLVCELNKRTNGKIGVIATVNDFVEIQPYMRQEWNEMINSVLECDNVKEWGFNTVIPEEKRSKEFEFMSGNIMNYLDSLELMFYMVSLKEADFFANLLNKKISISPDEISAVNRLRFYEMFAMIELYAGNTSKVVIACSLYDKTAQMFPSAAKKFTYYYILTINQINKGQASESNEYLSRCIDAAYETGNAFLMFKADLLKHMTRFTSWNHVWLYEHRSFSSNELIDNAKKYNYYNHLAHMYIFAMDNDRELFSKVEGFEERIVNFNTGIEIAKCLGNGFLIKTAYRRNLMISSSSGYFDVARYIITEKIKPNIEETGDKFEEGNMYNDLGYNSCAIEKYSIANEYFIKALDIFTEINRIDYIAETFYNMAINSIMAHDYSYALDSLDNVMKIINLYHSESLRVAHISKIYGLLSYCNYKVGKVYESYSYLNLAEVFMKNIIMIEGSKSLMSYWEDDLFLYHICKGMHAMGENNYNLAQKEYEKAYFFGGPGKGGAAFFYSIYAKEVYKLLINIDVEEANNELRKCYEFYSKGGYKLRAKEIENLLNQVTDKDVLEEISGKLNIEGELLGNEIKERVSKIIEKAKIDFEMKKYEQCLTYLQTWQNIKKIPYVNVEHMVYNLMLSVSAEFNLDKLLLVTRDKNGFRVRYNNLGYAFGENSIKFLSKYFETHTKLFTATKMNKNFFEYEKVANLFTDDHLCSIVGVPVYEKDNLIAFVIGYIKMKDNCGAATKSIVIEKYEAEFLEFLCKDLLSTMEKFKIKEDYDRLVEKNKNK